MKWGHRNEKGCKDAEFGKLHPLLCDKSLDLKCFDKSCPHKLHTLRCKRKSVLSADDSRSGRPPGQGAQPQKNTRRQTSRRTSSNTNPWQTQPDHSHLGQAGDPTQGGKQQPLHANDEGFQKLTVQPQLDAYMIKIRQEMWEEVRVLRTFLAREMQLAQLEGLRPSC